MSGAVLDGNVVPARNEVPDRLGNDEAPGRIRRPRKHRATSGLAAAADLRPGGVAGRNESTKHEDRQDRGSRHSGESVH